MVGEREQIFNERLFQNVLCIQNKIIIFNFKPYICINALWLREVSVKKNKTIKVLRRKCRVIFITRWWGKSKQSATPEP